MAPNWLHDLRIWRARWRLRWKYRTVRGFLESEEAEQRLVELEQEQYRRFIDREQKAERRQRDYEEELKRRLGLTPDDSDPDGYWRRD